MSQNASQQKIATAPLLSALKNIQFGLERNQATRVIVAKETLRKLKQQKLPAHVRVSVRPRRGKRVALRGVRNQEKTRLAVWPDDQMVEPAQPILAFVISGQGGLHVADYILHCQSGDIIFFPAGVPKFEKIILHSDDESPSQSCTLLWLYPGQVLHEGLECWISQAEKNHYESSGNLGGCWIKNRFAAQLYQGLTREVESTFRAFLVDHLLKSLTFLIASEIESGKALPSWSKPASSLKTFSHDIVEEACLYIDEHLNDHLTIAAVARVVAVSPATLTRRFRNEKEYSFLEYLSRKRLEKAGVLLLETQVPIDTICNLVGLKYSQLRRLFVAEHACSPGEFRTRDKNK